MNHVDVLRDNTVESRHAVHAAVVNANGELLASVGDPNLVSFMRSSAKPFQAVVFANNYPNMDPRFLAIACASHAGEDVHASTVNELLALTGVNESWLICGSHPPFDALTRKALRERNEKPGVLRNNCSGKHTAMLANCVLQSWPHVGYATQAHPLQQEILKILEELAAYKYIVVAVDGCGVPCYALPLLQAAKAVACLALPSKMSLHEKALIKISAAMRQHPYLVAGRNLLDTMLMRSVPGLVSKIGAEGYQILALQDSQFGPLGVALKIEDGAERARDAAVLRVLAELGLITESDPIFSERAVVSLNNHAGTRVGQIRADFKLHFS